ncbi:hypothetical protein GCM10022419_088440 [Nonomuraea rosea]|uniref:Uncharacterized protein n=1 Tax=Nonomuraea rosea TaxID=638574 RepID=A0ABP6YWF6_9ACTN
MSAAFIVIRRIPSVNTDRRAEQEAGYGSRRSRSTARYFGGMLPDLGGITSDESYAVLRNDPAFWEPWARRAARRRAPGRELAGFPHLS